MLLCAALCLIGVLLEAEFNQPITFHTVLAGFKPQPSPASRVVAPTQPKSLPGAAASHTPSG
jgi:hypothetical protein